MIFAGVGILALLGTMVLSYRRSTEERSIQWKIYAIRDSLRRFAFDRPEFGSSELFRVLDASFTTLCATMGEISLWTVATMFVSRRIGRAAFHEEIESRHKQIQRELALPENQPILGLYVSACRLMVIHLTLRHIFLALVFGITIIPGILAYSLVKWVSARLMSGAFNVGTGDQRVRVAA